MVRLIYAASLLKTPTQIGAASAAVETGFCALKIAGFAGHCDLLQKAQKRVLTGKTADHISRHFRRGARRSADEKRASARLFDIAGIRKRNAGGMSG